VTELKNGVAGVEGPELRARYGSLNPQPSAKFLERQRLCDAERRLLRIGEVVAE
jgi:hypothetical protein